MHSRRADGPRIHRRNFLQIGAIPLMGVSLPNLLANESIGAANGAEKSAKNIILVWLGGGPSTIDMWDLKPEARASIRGEFKPIPTSAPDISICEHLPQMAKQMDHCTLIRSLWHTIAEHEQGTEHVLTGNPITPALKYPSLGSIVSHHTSTESGKAVPSYVAISGMDLGGAGYLGSSHNPFIVDTFSDRRSDPAKNHLGLPDGFTVNDLRRKRKLLESIEQGFSRFDETTSADEMSSFQQQALDILTSGRTRNALDVFQEDEKVIQRYGSGSLGLSALAARRLLQAGVRFVTIAMDGWDTHRQNFAQLRDNLLPPLDAGLSALIEDLDARGMLQETIVYCVGEFNRTPMINDQGGRDHWARAMSVLVSGGGFKSGFAYGSTDKEGFEPESCACSPADVNATLLHRIGIHCDTKLVNRTGRALPMFREASILNDLYS
jgi:hypothetical protein